MSKHPVLKLNQVVSILQKLGFVEVRQKGSHKLFRHSAGRFTSVPFHKGRDFISDYCKTNYKGYKYQS